MLSSTPFSKRACSWAYNSGNALVGTLKTGEHYEVVKNSILYPSWTIEMTQLPEMTEAYFMLN